MIVVDASVALKWVLPEAHSALALQLYLDAVRGDHPVVAPALLPSEVANALRQRIRKKDLSAPRALQLYDQFLTFAVTFESDIQLVRQSLVLSIQLELPAIYDAIYLAVAQAEACPLWTADERLVQAGRGLGFVHSIASYSGNPAP